MKIKEGGVMDIQKENNLIQEAFEVEADEVGFCLDQKWGDYENPYESSDTALAFNLFKKGWQASKDQVDQKIKLLLCDEHLKKCESPTGIFNSQYPDEEPCLICLAKEAKAQAMPEGFVLVSAEQMSQWGHMASYAEQYGCPECFEARGYAHSLACEINAYFNVSEAKEPAND